MLQNVRLIGYEVTCPAQEQRRYIKIALARGQSATGWSTHILGYTSFGRSGSCGYRQAMQPGYKDVATDAAAIREGASSPQMRMIANPASTRPVAARLASRLMGTSELGASAFTAWVVDFKRIKSGR